MSIASPSSPDVRLSTLDYFCRSWVTTNIDSIRPGRAQRIRSGGVTNLVAKLSSAYDRCGYFDPSVPNGGPRPEGTRKRREDDKIDVFDEFFNSGNLEKSMIRLDQDPDVAWRQITTGLKVILSSLRQFLICFNRNGWLDIWMNVLDNEITKFIQIESKNSLPKSNMLKL